MTYDANDHVSKAHEAWVFYKFATQRGTVTVRWCGTDNCGYYCVFPDVLVEMRA